MSKGFNFERNLPHQVNAVESIMQAFQDCSVLYSKEEYVNNEIGLNSKMWLNSNMSKVHEYNDINKKYKSDENIFDIQMETGTGKTYTYTKTMFELNKNYGIFKFVIVVPTLSIKAGTVNFLKSDSAKEHFRTEYGKTINTYVVDSKELKPSQLKKKIFPSSASGFIRATNFGNNIHVLVINSGMIVNGRSIYREYDINMFDKYAIPLEGIQACKTVMIIDEPHKFKENNKTFEKLLSFKSQFILRYGATFDNEYKNLVYQLNAIDSFNQDLVKGITVHIDEFEAGKNEYIQLVETNGTEAKFKISNGKGIKNVTLTKNESLENIHYEVKNLNIDKLNKSIVVLSNGLELSKGSKINPFSYSNTLQERMLKKAVINHFKLEKQYLMRAVKIKPLTLFFIDDIASYRDNGTMAIYFESLLKSEIKKILDELDKTSLKEDYEIQYVDYLNQSLKDIKSTHGGYFSQDNKSKDEEIENEINEIIHDKEKLIEHTNIRRFIFSKWTLREGWDNPNVFQIVKLRTSGSETSKLQEVGRGLRIPVNQYMERVKSEQFELHYFVDFTEKEFVDNLTKEINFNNEDKVYNFKDDFEEKMIPEFENKRQLYNTLIDSGILNEDMEFTEDGFEKLKEDYPNIIKSLKKDKVKKSTDDVKMVSVRTENYNKLKYLWEEINKKVLIEYKFESEEHVKKLFLNAIVTTFGNIEDVKAITHSLDKNTGLFISRRNITDDNDSVSTLMYGSFLKHVAKDSGLNIETIHKTFIDLKNEYNININDYLNMETVRVLKQAFNEYLIMNVNVEYKIEYNSISNNIHPTKLTDKKGNALSEIKASDVGRYLDKSTIVSEKYLYDEAYYDSELEKRNIDSSKNNEVSQIIVYAKIPKGSVRIPIVGGFSYSPDFAYVVEYANGKKELNLIIETKDKKKSDLSTEEDERIKLAESLYSNNDYDVVFKRQMTNKSMSDIISEIVNPRNHGEDIEI